MITINLLPEAYRRPAVSSAQQLYRSPLALLLLLALLGLGGLLVIVYQVRVIQLGRLTQQLQALDAQKGTVDELSSSSKTLRDQKAVFERLLQQRSHWGRYLNRLSDVTPDGVWFTDLMLDREKGLVLQGSAVHQNGEEMGRIGRLTQDLKGDADFAAMIPDVQIDSIKSTQDHDIELSIFTLTGKLAKPAEKTTP